MGTTTLKEGDRLFLRDRPWRVRKVTVAGKDHHIVEVEALDDDFPAVLSAAVPPEDVEPLPSEAVEFDLRGLDSLASWSRAHLLLGATLVRETGLLTGARFGRVALEAYQLAPVLRLLAKPRPALLIADDVGLGKTIEAGLAVLELMARGRASRILVVTPPGLMDQWREELLDKFGLEFAVIDNVAGLSRVQTDLPAGTNPWDALPRVITSIDYLKKETVRNRALRKRWDLVIVDEAHALAKSGTPENPYRTQRTRLGLALRGAARGLLLLTATPHNGYSHSFRSLVELVDPTLAALSGSAENVRRRIETARIRRMKAQIQRRLPDGREEPVFPQRSVRGIPVTPPTDAEKDLLRKVASYCSRTARGAAGTEDAELVGFAMQIVKKRALSSRAALAKTIEHRLEALRSEEAREEPPDRAELRDLQADLPLGEAAAERTARKILRSAIPTDERRRKAEISALDAIRRILRKLPGSDPKIEALLAELRRVLEQDPAEKVIVFTEYRDTLDAIQAWLDADEEFAGRYVILCGGLTRGQRLARQEAFERPEIRLLLATDAASEGLNLQRQCRRVIHFELPWNPNRLEQRNGRVDRYGQTREPVIRYLYYPDSPEESVLDQLVGKIERMAADRVSTPDILGLLAGERRIQEGLTELDPDAPDVESRKISLVRLFDDRTAEFVRNVQPLLAAGDDSAAEQGRILALLDTAEPLLPDDVRLEEIVLGIMGGDAVQADRDREGVFRIQVPPAYRGPAVAAVYPAATFRRSVAVRYRPQDVEYLTPRHPLVQALAADARRRLLQVYPDSRGLRPRRLAAHTVPTGEKPSILFTFLGSIQGGGGLLEEDILAVRVDTGGNVLPGDNSRYLAEVGGSGEVASETLERLFAGRFEAMRERAEREACRLLEERAQALRQRRAEQAAILRRDLETDTTDRLQEIVEEERRARGLVDETGQGRLFAEEPARGGFGARRTAVEAAATRRREEIAEFEKVELPGPPPAARGALSGAGRRSPVTFRHLHNARGFFSDYYLGSVFGRGSGRGRRRTLSDRETDLLYARFRRIRERAEGRAADPAECRERFARPLLRDVLGFHLGAGEDRVHGLFSSAEAEAAGERPLLVCYCGGWDEDLDAGRGMAQPVRRIEAALARGNLRYGLLLTGERLRLVRAAGDGPRGAYLEVDLEGLADEDDPESFAAFVRLLSARSFLPDAQGNVPIEEVEKESREHAEKVSEDLKQAVFRSAESLVAGLIADAVARGRIASPLDLAEDQIRTYRDAALLGLYRILFILYAEARDPRLDEHRLYRDSYSAQGLLDEVLRDPFRAWPDNRATLWERLRALFRIYDQGLPPITPWENIPPRGGDFFSAKTPEGKILDEARLPDRAVARLVLDLATTAPRRGVGRERVSFRELDIESLGAVYEGLLEYEPRIARATTLEVRVQGRTYALSPDEVVRLCEEKNLSLKGDFALVAGTAATTLHPESREEGEAVEEPGEEIEDEVEESVADEPKDEEASEEGQGVASGAAARILRRLEPGDFHFVPGPGRKGSGSFYTPRALVQDLVRHALGPLVEGKTAGEIERLRVLDPACGSAHFLVEAMRFLGQALHRAYVEEYHGKAPPEFESRAGSGWDDNWRATDEEARAANSEARAWCKRRIAERCLFGVDLNPTAVQLARVALWIESVAGDRPLTYFEHHIRCGNSLLGSWMDRLEDPPLPAKTFNRHQISLPFQEPVRRAVREAARARRTIDEARPEDLRREGVEPESVGEQEFKEHLRRKAEETLATAKLLFDLRSAAAFVPDIWREWEPLCSLVGSPQKLRAHAEGRPWWSSFEKVRRRERFFHWELEFPEVFLDSARPGFDAILGNPPWDKVKPDKKEFYGRQDILIRAFVGASSTAGSPSFMPRTRGSKRSSARTPSGRRRWPPA